MICGVNPFCDETKNYCILGACIDKTTVYYVTIAGVFLLMMSARAYKSKQNKQI